MASTPTEVSEGKVAPVWGASIAYGTPDTHVTYHQKVWKNQWWSMGDIPGVAAVWIEAENDGYIPDPDEGAKGNPFKHGKKWGKLTCAPCFDNGGLSQDLEAYREATGLKAVALTFILYDGSSKPMWGGSGAALGSGSSDQYITSFRNNGGDVSIGFGGENAISVPGARSAYVACGFQTVQEVHDAYLDVIIAYNATQIFFDIEGNGVKDLVSNKRRSLALVQLRETLKTLQRDVTIDLLLPVLPTGYVQDGETLIRQALDLGFMYDRYSLMAMDYNQSISSQSDAALGAARGAFSYLSSQPEFADMTAGNIWQRIGLLPMIGKTDSPSDAPTYPRDMARICQFAKTTGLSLVSFWSVERDRPSNNSTSSGSGLIDVPANTFGQSMAGFTDTMESIPLISGGNATTPTLPPTLVAATSSAVRLAWDYTVNAVAYRVKWGEQTQSTPRITTDVDGLTAATEYGFSVCSMNEKQEFSDYTSEAKFSTADPDFMVEMPQDCKVGDVKYYEAEFSWTAPPATQLVDSYRITLNGEVYAHALPADQLSVTIKGLHADIKYTVSVAAQTIDQFSDECVGTFTTPNEADVPAWQSAQTYAKGDIVRYTSSHGYADCQAKNQNTGYNPTCTGTWPWIQLNHFDTVFDWVSGGTYAGGKCVWHNSVEYKAKYWAGGADEPGIASVWEAIS